MQITHWVLLVNLLKRVISFLVLSFFVFWYCSDFLYLILSAPIINILPKDSFLISISLLNSILMPMQLSWYVAIWVTIPYLFFELWRFIAPALTKIENSLIWPIIFVSWLLFCLGSCFAYFCVLPVLFNFLVSVTPKSVHLAPDIMHYLELCNTLLLTFGSAAELPMVMFVLTILKIFDLDFWLKNRPNAILLAFVLGMLLTPPDVISQVLLAIPLCFLYELGIVIIKLFKR